MCVEVALESEDADGEIVIHALLSFRA
jgi:hypothetical protein